MREAEQVTRPLNELYDQKEVEIVRMVHEANGVVPIEISKMELMVIVNNKGFEIHSFGPYFFSKDVGSYWISPKNEGSVVTWFDTKLVDEVEAVYVLDTEFSRFTEFFFNDDTNS